MKSEVSTGIPHTATLANRGVPDGCNGSAESDRQTKVLTVIEPRRGWHFVDGGELWAYRDLFRFLVWRDIKVRYAQSAIGIGWAIIQPVFSMVIFTIIFGRLARVASDGAPYAVFSLTALVPWTYFSNSLTDGVNGFVGNANMLKKIYFPRLLIPLSSVVAKLVDFAIAMAILLVMLFLHGILPNAGILVLPLLILVMLLTTAGITMILSALAIQYRDVKYALNFVIQILMYAAPVVYPSSLIPAGFQLLYSLNPMVGVIEGFRAALIGTRAMPTAFITVGLVSSAALFLLGMLVFRGKERLFADVA